MTVTPGGARDLLAKLGGLPSLGWRKKPSTRARLMESINDTLDAGLPRAYTPELYRRKRAAMFKHVYESCPERRAGVYATAGSA